jgi:hypothetical protein
MRQALRTSLRETYRKGTWLSSAGCVNLDRVVRNLRVRKAFAGLGLGVLWFVACTSSSSVHDRDGQLGSPCSENDDCTGEGLVCGPKNSCVECVLQSDCDSDEVCANGACGASIECREKDDCPSSLTCDVDASRCVECLDVGDCEDGDSCTEQQCVNGSGGQDGSGGSGAQGGDNGSGASTQGGGGTEPNGGAGGGVQVVDELGGVLTFGERPDSRFEDVTFDTYLRENAAQLNYGNSGQISFNQDARVALIRFDISSILEGRVVKNATLKLQVLEGDCETSASTTTYFYPLVEAWDEGGGSMYGSSEAANWLQRQAGGITWTSSSFGEGTTSPILAGSVGELDINEYAVDLAIDVVQEWIDGDNFGLLIRSESTGSDEGCFESSESAELDARPELEIELEPL